jgi:SAM-dependent methyltransferase
VNKFDLQDNEYNFPYHYLVSLENNLPLVKKELSWGVEYLTYMTYIKSYIETNIKPQSMLDIGCGDGYLINSLKYDENNNYQGIDLSKKAVGFANAFSNGYKFNTIDLFDISEKFDLVSLIEVIEHIPDYLLSEFIKEAFDKVKDGGYLIISVPTDITPVQEKHYRHYNEKMLNEQIGVKNTDIVNEVRLYKKSRLLEKTIKLVFNLRSKTIKSRFWKWHQKKYFYADKNNGKHIIRVYKIQK